MVSCSQKVNSLVPDDLFIGRKSFKIQSSAKVIRSNPPFQNLQNLQNLNSSPSAGQRIGIADRSDNSHRSLTTLKCDLCSKDTNNTIVSKTKILVSRVAMFQPGYTLLDKVAVLASGLRRDDLEPAANGTLSTQFQLGDILSLESSVIYMSPCVMYRVSHIRCSTARHERGCAACPRREQDKATLRRLAAVKTR
jgi:hypothetical protein